MKNGLQIAIIMQISYESSPYKNFIFALKSKDVKRQYPAMLSRFFDFIKIEHSEKLEEKCKIFYDFASKLENREECLSLK